MFLFRHYAVLILYSMIQVYRHSFLARYTVVDVVTGNESEISPLNLPNDEEPYLQNFVWGPSGNAFAFVYLNNIYYQSSLSSNPVQLTTTGLQHVIYNGIPDWVYEGILDFISLSSLLGHFLPSPFRSPVAFRYSSERWSLRRPRSDLNISSPKWTLLTFILL